jgi:hypothetical protein
MNANELANKLADEVDIHVAMGGSTFFKEVSNMLRQFGLAESIIKQQELEIKDLKQQVAFLEDWRDTWSPTIKQLMNINVKVNNERK